jgi:hypothetical protein
VIVNDKMFTIPDSVTPITLRPRGGHELDIGRKTRRLISQISMPKTEGAGSPFSTLRPA